MVFDVASSDETACQKKQPRREPGLWIDAG
jgi:hypothetical protein